MSIKIMIVSVFCFGFAVILAGCVGGSVTSPITARSQFFKQSQFVFPARLEHWYEGSIDGEVMQSGGGSQKISGTLGFGGNAQQTLLHFKGNIGIYDLDIDILKEHEQVYVRSHSLNASGNMTQDSLSFFMGILSNAHGQFIRLNDFVFQQRIAYVIQSRFLFQELSGAIVLDAQGCKKTCPIIIDKDFLPAATSPIIRFLGAIEKQNVYYDPDKQLIVIDSLQTHTAGIHGELDKDDLSILRNERGFINKVYKLSHHIQANEHQLELAIEHDGELTQLLHVIFDTYPDGWNMMLETSRADGLESHIEGKRYDVGYFVPVDKGNVLDMYGLLNSY